MKPQWEILYEDIRAEIRTGNLAPGERLPTENELAARRGVSRNTVRRAYLALSQDGAIRSVNGRGSFVARADLIYEVDAVSRLRGVLEQQGLTSGSRLVDIGVIDADESVSKNLLLSPGDPVLTITSIITGDNIPFNLTTRYFPADLIEDFQKKLLIAGSFTRVLSDAGLGELRRRSTTVGARLADEREAELLECPRNAPVLEVFATGILDSGRTVEWQHAIINSRLMKLTFTSC